MGKRQAVLLAIVRKNTIYARRHMLEFVIRQLYGIEKREDVAVYRRRRAGQA